MNLSELKLKANNLPLKPGVYIMKDKSGDIIYIGKAKSLKNCIKENVVFLEKNSILIVMLHQFGCYFSSHLY